MNTTVGCALVRPGQGDAIWALGEKMTFKLEADMTSGEFVVHDLIALPRNGPPPHLHRNEDEMFMVVDGEFEFHLQDRAIRCKRGDAVYLPKNTLHTYTNVGSCPGKLVVTCAPAGFDSFIRSWGQPVADKTEIPPQVTQPAIDRLLAAAPQFGIELHPEIELAAEPVLPPPCKAWWVLDHLVEMKLTAGDTLDKFSVAVVTSSPKSSVPPHLHIAMDEFFYVIDGEMEFLLDDRTERVGPGTLVYVPKGTPHGFENVSGGPAQFFDVHTPGGFEKFFEEAGVPANDLDTPPDLPPMDPERLTALFQRHGMQLV